MSRGGHISIDFCNNNHSWRLLRYRFLLLVAILLPTVLLIGSPAQASPSATNQSTSASDFHGYSVAWNFNTSHYTGVEYTRYDVQPTRMSSGSYCTSYFTAPVLYQPEWVINGSSWIELGTGHQCNGFEYWYAGYGINGTWQPIFTRSITSTDLHKFSIDAVIVRDRGAVYYYNIDVTTVAQYATGLQGTEVEAGLESYDSYAIEPAYTISAIYYASGYGGFSPWYNTTDNNPVSPMCGRLVSSTQYRAGENTTC